MRKILFALVSGVGLTAGCANNSANMRVGTDMTYMSLKDQREASLTVGEYATSPTGAQNLGTVDASRCHRNSLQAQPTDTEIKLDLKAAAYARGANGISDIQIERTTGLLLNCWAIINGRATALNISK